MTFTLPYEWASPDVVVAELGGPLGEKVKKHGLQVLSGAPPPAEKWEELRKQYRHPSDADLYALWWAVNYRWGLLTGDWELRQAAKAQGLEVHGVLWILDQLVATERLCPLAAARALKKMLEGGARLPPEACQKRLQQWERA